MAPTWIPLCRSMQLYCEPYFASINNWRAYKQEAILHNRLRLVETACQIFHAHSNNPVLHKFDIVCHHPDIPLLPEVPPTAGREYKVGGDQLAFETAKRTQPKDLFHKAGVFFQDNLLKAIAGWTAEILAGANIETRATIIAAVEKLFRIPEEAGEARFVYTVENAESHAKKDIIEYPSVELSERGLQFFRYIVETRQPGYNFNATAEKKTMVEAVDAKKKNNKRGRSEEEDEWEADAEGVLWTKKHASVGTQVASYFPPPDQDGQQPTSSSSAAAAVLTDPVEAFDAKLGKLFRGKVIKYAPPSEPGLTDQLYHIRWEDGDEQDFDEVDMEKGMDLFDRLEGWTVRHNSVGLRVAAYFPVPGTTRQKLFCGAVTKFGAPTSEDEVPLYHVVFDDGDEQDFNEQELNLGIRLYVDEKETVAFEGARSGKKAAAAKPASKKAAAGPASKAARTESPSPRASKQASPTASTTSRNSSRSAAKEVAKPAAKSTSKNVSPPQKSPKASILSASSGSKSKSAASSGNKSDKQQVIEILDEVGDDEEDEEEEEPLWTMKHDSVGKRVAQHFLLPGPRNSKPKFEVFGGTVAVYAPPSKPNAKDQLYHIVWDDGDEQDFDEAELQAGLRLLEGLMPSPLYRASKEAKANVTKRQHEMVVDAAAAVGSTSAVVTVDGSASENGSTKQQQEQGDEAAGTARNGASSSTPHRSAASNASVAGSAHSQASQTSKHSAHSNGNGSAAAGDKLAPIEEEVREQSNELAADFSQQAQAAEANPMEVEMQVVEVVEVVDEEERAVTPDGNGTEADSDNSEGSAESECDHSNNSSSGGAESDVWQEDEE